MNQSIYFTLNNGKKLLISKAKKSKEEKLQDHDWKIIQAHYLSERNKAGKRILADRYEGYATNPFLRKKTDAQAFSAVEDDVIKLAKAGYLHAIAFYLMHVEKNQDEQIVELAQDVKAKSDRDGEELSPEQMEVLFALDFYGDFGKYMDSLTGKLGNLTDFKMLLDAHDDAWTRNYWALVDERAKEYEISKVDYINICETLNETSQLDLIQGGLMGYYGRLFISEKPTIQNLDEYLFLANETHGALQNQELFGYVSKVLKFDFTSEKSEIDKNFYEKRENLAKALYRSAKNDRSFDGYMALSRYYALYQLKENKFDKGYLGLEAISGMPFESEAMTEKTSEQKTPVKL